MKMLRKIRHTKMCTKKRNLKKILQIASEKCTKGYENVSGYFSATMHRFSRYACSRGLHS